MRVRINSVVGVAAVFGTLVASVEAAVQWSGNGHWYEYRLDGGGQDVAYWTAQAGSEGAHLVTLTSEAESAFAEALRDADGPNTAYLTGGYQDSSAWDYAEPDGGWRWVTGEIWSHEDWGIYEGSQQPDDQPDWGGGANTVGMPWQTNGQWVDVPDSTQWAAMIEWSADCNGDGIVDYGQIMDGTYEDTNGNGVPDCCDQGVACDPITVDDDGPADYNTIQAAVDASVDGDTIIVYPGVYVASAGEVVRLADHDVTLRSLEGADVTVIDGQGVSRGIVTGGGLSSTEVDGFTVTNCLTGGGGGGLLVGSGSSITFLNMIVASNHAGNEGGGMNAGGAGVVTLNNCLFWNNSASNGAGVHCHDSIMVASECRFEGNVASGVGGGVHNGDGMPLSIGGTSFCNNAAASGDDVAGNWTDAGGNVFDDCGEDDCPADTHGNGDGVVAVDDLLIVIGNYGSSGPSGDVDEDGVVGVNDILVVIDTWGPCP